MYKQLILIKATVALMDFLNHICREENEEGLREETISQKCRLRMTHFYY